GASPAPLGSPVLRPSAGSHASRLQMPQSYLQAREAGSKTPILIFHIKMENPEYTIDPALYFDAS
ncbi:MAG: hypothetical protein ABUL54_02360, partial [Dongia sp.]